MSFTRILFPVLLLVMLVAAAGCRNDTGAQNARQAEAYRRTLDASGRRVLLVNPDGEVVRKLRKQRDRIKVYAGDMTALGSVRWKKPADGSKGPVSVEMTLIKPRKTAAIKPVESDAKAPTSFEMPGHFRIEKDRDKWAVFSPEDEPVGTFERDDNQAWLLRTGDNPAVFRVETPDQGPTRITRDGKTRAQLRTGDLAPVVLLALQLPHLSPAEQVAVGVWLAHLAG